MASQHQPRINEQAPAHVAKFATFTANIDLRAQSGYPQHCPQRLFLQNNTDGSLNATLVDIAGHSLVLAVPARTGIFWDAAVASIGSATDDTLSAVFAFWWVDGSTVINP
jgi:hypothetical protein